VLCGAGTDELAVKFGVLVHVGDNLEGDEFETGIRQQE
jgi:hypothetical protein